MRTNDCLHFCRIFCFIRLYHDIIVNEIIYEYLHEKRKQIVTQIIEAGIVYLCFVMYG